ncbi:MAG TPA: endonuclease MutS2 [Candidatus Kapabacteria bacterium]|nr:endonuclease MutS2 [Candidatus Kapabacteria bacterium]
MMDDSRNERNETLELHELKSIFLRRIPKQFRLAAEKLELPLVLEAHLHHVSTALGRSALTDELVPSLDREKIIRSLAEIDELRKLFTAGESPSFSAVSDIRTTLHKVEIEGSTIYQDEGLPLVTTLKAVRLLREFFAKRVGAAPTLWRAGIHLYEDKLLEMAFDSVFDENGNVRDNASSELHEIRREIVATSERLRNKLASLIKKYTEDDLLQEQIITLRDGRAVIPVKAEHKRKIPGMIHAASQTGQTIYIEPSETIDLNNELRSLEFSEQREIDRIMRELTDRLRNSVKPLLRALEITGHLEAVYAKSRYADSINAATPKLIVQRKPEELQLVLHNARHPFLIAKLGIERTIAFDLDLDKSNHTLILTGPNAGGKTVLLKTLGLAFLFVYAGLPIPAEGDSIIPSIDGLYVDIGDSQSIADDLSTFSSHIRTLKNILSDVNEYSVVLLDEIGSGTAPEEGGALAESILEHLTKSAGVTVATTHYGRLAGFAESVEGALNGSMEFASATLEPTYRFHMNVPGSSHAFDIAQRYELPSKIIARARELAGGKTNRLQELIDSLSEKEQVVEKLRIEMDKELGKARFERLEFERLRDEIASDKRKILATASKQADDLLSKANSFIERAIREAREAAAPSEKQNPEVDLSELRRKQKQELGEITKTIEEYIGTSVASVQNDLKLEVGSKVRMLSNPSQIGDIASMNNKEAEVLFGSVKMRVKLAQLEAVSRAEARREDRAQIQKRGTYFDELFKPKIDLRGKYGDEGVIEVEKFLSDANARSIDKVEILHGTGTGALGRRIQTFLRTSPLVKSFRFGERHEGGMGVTIVELK